MSFMFNPHPYDDPNAINRLKVEKEVAGAILTGTKDSADHISELILKKLEREPRKSVIIAFDGYVGAKFNQFVNLISQNLGLSSVTVKVIDIASCYKTSQELDALLADNLAIDKEKDPVQLFGKLFKGTYEDLLDQEKLSEIERSLNNAKSSNRAEVVIVTGCGTAIPRLRAYYDTLVYLDVTPKRAILRAKAGEYANIGDNSARPAKAMLRRCYYVDFEVAGHLRWELLKKDLIDFYVASDDPEDVKMLPRESFNRIMSGLVKQPFRCRPVYIEGVWGGHYVTKLRNLPKTMKNCAWVFDLIPLEVSVVVETAGHTIEFPYFTFVQKEGDSLMGKECVKKYGGYFPIRFNYDDTFHSSGNMSIQVHSGHDYNINNFGEYGRQDESYYIVETAHNAKTYVGFTETADPKEFIKEAKISEKQHTEIDYEKYINYVDSKPGVQVMLPAGTIHSSGRNQVILEIGSLTVGSYTYKMYDYLRADLDGKPRPIHTFHGENVLALERKTKWVNDNIVQKPRVAVKGEGWTEYIVGEHDLLYFTLRRLEFEKEAYGDTAGKFHVLTLVDGEKVCVQSLENPELCYYQNYLDVVVIPANVGKYVVKNLGNQPVCIHKTMLKDGFVND
ncbi:MAG: class I mannose-6-phosphate isomerase [Bacteroidales bacterium]|nr:class I mannose-6-phosphate isomerase [Bacteroidales bacterium]